MEVKEAIEFIERYRYAKNSKTDDIIDLLKSLEAENKKLKKENKALRDVEDGGIADDDYNHNSTPKTTAKSTDKATDKQIGLIKKQILESHLMNDEEKKRLEKKVNNGLSKTDASTIISWWLGDSKKGTEGERAIREQQESLEEDVINVEDEGNADFDPAMFNEKVASKS